MYFYCKAFVFMVVLFICLTITGYVTAQDSILQFVKNANWLGEQKGDIYLLHKRDGGQAKSFEEVFSSYVKFKEVSWREFREIHNNKEYVFIEARGLLLNSEELGKELENLINQNESWIFKSLGVNPQNVKIDPQVTNKVLNELKAKKLSFVIVSLFLPELEKNRARFRYLGGVLVDPENKSIRQESRVKNYNITLEKSNFYRNIEYTDVKAPLAEIVLLEHGYQF